LEWLNYHHLQYFWLVAREGGIQPAAKLLGLAHPTISGQIKQLEQSLDQQLFDRSGRRLRLTEVGKLVYRYAEDIFTTGKELQRALEGDIAGKLPRLVVGVTEAMPKLVVRAMLEPALAMDRPVQLAIEEDRQDRLLAELALHNLDIVLSDVPVPSDVGVKAFSHLLGECGVVFLAVEETAAKYREGFPGSLSGAPWLAPTSVSNMRRELDQWFEDIGAKPSVVAEFADSALLKVFGGDGFGVFAVPTAIEKRVCEQFGVSVVGHTEAVRARFYAISTERRLRHPAALAITQSARRNLFE